MVKSAALHRRKFTTHADGSDAVLFLHELVGEQDGPTIGISRLHPRQREYRLASDPRALSRAEDDAAQGPNPVAPVANARAFAVNHRFTPIDELNLNREFPGDVKGNYTQQLAAAITREFLEKIDIHIDLHSGTDRPTVDYVYIWNDEQLSRAFGSKILYRPTQGKEGTVFSGTTKTVTLDRRKIRPRGRAWRRHRRPDALCPAHCRWRHEHAAVEGRHIGRGEGAAEADRRQ